MEVSVKESDLLNLPEYVDNFMKNSRAKDAGYLKFNIVDSCGSSTSLEKFIFKFGDAMGPSLKTLHPITVPHANDIYGHLSIQNQFICRETVEGFEKEMKNPFSYTVTSQNCCMTTLRKSGVDGLLKHYFDHELPSHAKLPPQCRWHRDLRKLKVTAAAKKGHLSKTRNDLASLTENEQGEKLQKILESPKMKINEQKSVQSCPCPQCVYTEEIYGLKVSNQDELQYDVEVDPVATANYYDKGFLYANNINVESKDRNLITPNFSLSYLNLISITSLLDGHFPGLSTPHLHVGGVHSFFPLHVEDLSLFSISFLHHGYPKLWIVVPPHAVSKLTFTILKEINHSGLCLGILSHKYHLVSPTWLETHGIPFNVVIQMSGQGVIVTPNAAHFGFNLGPNLTEAVNFGTVSWIPYGIVHPSCTCLPGQVHADLGPIVQSFCPDMLNDYLLRKIPKVPNNQQFTKSLVYPEFVEENVKLKNAAEMIMTADDEVVGECLGPFPEVSVNRRKIKKHSKRKIIVCPLCETHYAGGHKMRLYKHIRDAHRNLNAEEHKRVESILEEMFPERGNKLQKVTCKKCGNDLAGLSSLKRHQASQRCLGK